jgi:hypothetical protein
MAGLAERVHREQNEPYVIVDIEPYMPGHPLMVLVIQNIGTTVARNVRISADRRLETTWCEESAGSLQRVLTRPIPMLPPGRRLTYKRGTIHREPRPPAPAARPGHARVGRGRRLGLMAMQGITGRCNRRRRAGRCR